MDILDKVTDPKLRGMIKLCRQEVPGFQIKFKDQSAWMKFLNFFVQIFNKDFMTRYTTTMEKTVYFPNEQRFLALQRAYAETLAHELDHMVERQQEGIFRYTLRYGFPQILAALSIFSVLAIWNLWFLLCLLFLLCLAPIPAPGRRAIELNGYTMSMAVEFWETGTIHDETFERITRHFTESDYYFMWPWRASIMHELKMRAQLIRTNDILRRPLFAKVRAVFTAPFTPAS